MNRLALLLFSICALAWSAFATEPLKPVQLPCNRVYFANAIELKDDVYSDDFKWSVELAPFNFFSIYTDLSYRLISYEWNTMLHDQRHEMINRHINGMNESFLGIKFYSFKFFGINADWRFKPGNGSNEHNFNRLGIEPVLMYPWGKGMFVAATLQYYTFLENKDFQPGDEMGSKASFIWDISSWELAYTFLYRTRIEESRNMHMKHEFRDMHDRFHGYRLRAEATRFINLFPFPTGIGLAYEMSRGKLFSFETGHHIEFYLKTNFKPN